MVGDTASKRWRLAIDFLALLAAVAIILSGWALYDRFSTSNHARSENRAVWHAVICGIEQAVVKDDKTHKRTADHTRTVLAFYDRLLVEDVHAAPCGIVVSEVRP